MQEKPLFKQIKAIPLFFLSLILVSGGMGIYRIIYDVGKTRSLDVRIYNLHEKTFKTVAIGENEFTTGFDGELAWKVNSVKEAFLVSLVDRNNIINFYDLFYFLLVDVALFVMVHSVNEDAVFSERLLKGVTVLLYLTMLYPFFGMIADQINGEIIKTLTNSKFTNQYQSFAVVKFQMFIYLMVFMLPFVKKAINLQKEQDLTI
ncbi:MAG: hypothetical protein H7202_13365 [Pedobacter sp.]|nr:hypothetical protein [Pedobacter sp.]